MTQKPPKPDLRPSLALLFLSIAAGLLAGLIGYWIGQYFYVLFVYPFILLALAVLLYLPTRRLRLAASPLYNAFCGFMLGLMVFTSFHYVEYAIFRTKAIRSLEQSQQADEAAASRSLDGFLQHKTGLTGFAGFMKYRQSQLRPYVFYITRGGEITNSLRFYLHGKTAWLYLAGEAALLMLGSALAVLWMDRRIFPFKRPRSA